MDTERAIEILKDAKKRIENEENWCSHAYAKDSHGFICGELDSAARRWCAGGSLHKTDDKIREPVIYGIARTELTKTCETQKGLMTIEEVNDELGHAAIIECFDIAIANLRNELAPIKDEMEL